MAHVLQEAADAVFVAAAGAVEEVAEVVGHPLPAKKTSVGATQEDVIHDRKKRHKAMNLMLVWPHI